jgi:ubiquitin carboxyl-terminal hydrolase L5
MSDWCLIESDPGVFTELIRGFGVSGIQVEELYSIDEESFSALKPVHGLIFLFKWVGNSEIDGSFVNDDKIVFIKQVVTNACATQAILSLLMNLKHDDIDLGAHLTDFKSFIAEMDPEMRGMVMGSSDLIRTVHNSFTRQQLWELDDKRPQKDEDAFHFVAYLPINGSVF